MECRFFVGQKVICIDAAQYSPTICWIPPEEGTVYTIIAMESGLNKCLRNGHPHQDAPAILHLKEIGRPVNPEHGRVFGYASTRFRPATDISELEALLRTAPAKQKEPTHA